MDRRDVLRAAAALPLLRAALPGPAFAKFVATDSRRLIAAVKTIGKLE